MSMTTTHGYCGADIAAFGACIKSPNHDGPHLDANGNKFDLVSNQWSPRRWGLVQYVNREQHNTGCAHCAANTNAHYVPTPNEVEQATRGRIGTYVYEGIEQHRSTFAGPTDDYLTWKERRSTYDNLLLGSLMYELAQALGYAKADDVILDCARTVAHPSR